MGVEIHTTLQMQGMDVVSRDYFSGTTRLVSRQRLIMRIVSFSLTSNENNMMWNKVHKTL